MISRSRVDALLLALIVYSTASLAHFGHNAAFSSAYPNLPESLTPLRIMLAWLLEAAIGWTGYALTRSRFVRTGYVLLAFYAALGFDGFAHYALAPMSAHTLAMNARIWGEALTGAALLLIVATRIFRRPHESSPA